VTTERAATLTDVSCDIHGPMRYRFALDWWECVGFDGEGCTVPIVYSEDIFGCDPSGMPGVTVRYRNAGKPQVASDGERRSAPHPAPPRC